MNQPTAPPSTETIDASGWNIRQINDKLRLAKPDSSWSVVGLSETLPGVGAGLEQSIELRIEGSIGPFALMMSQSATVVVGQRAAQACGHSLQSGSILIHGDCGSFLAAYATGGIVTAYGRTGDFTAYCLNGGDVVVRSRCGDAAGTKMRSGTLVIGNGAGENLGSGMTGGTIFVRGNIASLAPSVKEIRMKDADSLRLGLLLARAGLKAPIQEFRAYSVESPAKANANGRSRP